MKFSTGSSRENSACLCDKNFAVNFGDKSDGLRSRRKCVMDVEMYLWSLLSNFWKINLYWTEEGWAILCMFLIYDKDLHDKLVHFFYQSVFSYKCVTESSVSSS